ncbi:MAG: DNA-3-methyladenine glycosylase I [Promethearchaeati archaeon SRVP18_Atabeyarchaeia-1]
MVKVERKRCGWGTANSWETRYHDEEWGVPSHDDSKLYELLTLEGAQAGLSWLTILKKRENYRKAFANFDPAKVAEFKEGDIKRLLQDEGIVRNRLKIESALGNARKIIGIQRGYGSFDKYIWQFIGGKPIKNRFKSGREVPATSMESDAMSKDLKKRGFRFVGSTICYSFMQAVGMVNDHLVDCFRYDEV